MLVASVTRESYRLIDKFKLNDTRNLQVMSFVVITSLHVYACVGIAAIADGLRAE